MFVAYHVCGISCLWQICKLCRNQLQHRVWSSLCVLYSIQRWPWSQPTKARITRQTDLLPIPRTDTQTLFSDWLILWICSLWSTCITLQPFRIFAVSVRLFFEPPVLDCGPKTDSALDRSATPGPQLSKTICILINNMRKVYYPNSSNSGPSTDRDYQSIDSLRSLLDFISIISNLLREMAFSGQVLRFRLFPRHVFHFKLCDELGEKNR
ncbi:unnamed protein product, partial [Nesidiocoris tenuis]